MAGEPTDAWKRFAGKATVPSEMRTAEWLRTPQHLRERSFYMAGVMHAEILEAFRNEIAEIAVGRRGLEESRKRLEQFLDRIGYRPAPGQEGTIKDLRASRRIIATLQTNVTLLQMWAEKERGLKTLRAYPGWELIRAFQKKVPRRWQERWQQVGGKLSDGRMIALKTDPVWAALGSPANFKDAIGVDYPPFAWGSGMRWQAVDFEEMVKLGFGDAVRKQIADSEAHPRPVSSPNETLETTPAVKSPEIRAALEKQLGGFAEWQGDALVFTDPNGTRRYTAPKVAEVITSKLPEGFPNLQADAAKAWAEDALGKVKLRPGTDRTDDFVRFVQRTEPLAGELPVWRGEYFARRADLEARLAELDAEEGSAVDLLADSWTLLEHVARSFASSKGLPYELVLVSKSHGSFRPIYPTIRKVLPKFGNQAEIITLQGTRFRIVGEPVFDHAGGVTRVQVEVEELP